MAIRIGKLARTHASPRTPPKRIAVLALCAGLAVFGGYNLIVNGFVRQFHQPAWDFASHYVAGTLWRSGGNPYDLQTFRAEFSKNVVPFDPNRHQPQYQLGFPYPPQAYFIAAPFSYLTLESANDAFAVVSLALWLGAMACFALTIPPQRRNAWLYGVLGLCLGSITVRDTFQFGQSSAFLCFSQALCLLLLQRGWPFAAGTTLAIMAIKPQAMILLMPVFLLRRDYRFLMGATVAVGVTGVLPLLLSGQPIVGTLMEMLTQIPRFSGGINAPDPGNALTSHMVHLEVLVARVAGHESAATRATSVVLVTILLSTAFWPLWHSKNRTDTRHIDFGLACSLCLVAFYNRWYSLYLLIPGILVLWDRAQARSGGRSRWLWTLWLTCLLAALIGPSSLIGALDTRNSGAWFRIVSPFRAWASLATAIALIVLRWQVPTPIEPASGDAPIRTGLQGLSAGSRSHQRITASSGGDV